MQEASPYPHSVIGLALYGLAILLGGGGLGSVVTHLLNRRQLTTEAQARAAKTKAEGRSLDSETIDRAYERINELNEIINVMVSERLQSRLEIERLSVVEFTCKKLEQQLAQRQIEVELADKQLKTMKAILDVNQIKLSDYDHLR